jgi:hypothetical protein
LTTVTISQSNYLPWRGYFSQILNSDFFVFLDNVQFTRRDWRTRNRIRTPQGTEWLNIPVVKAESRFEKIENVKIINNEFIQAHLETIRLNYTKAKFFEPNWPIIQDILNNSYNENLSLFNQNIIKSISKEFLLKCKFSNANEFTNSNDPTERLLNICLSLGADRYQSGPAAKQYLDVTRFNANGIEVVWAEYCFETYQQLWNLDFDSNVSIVDLILNVGFDQTFLKTSKEGFYEK